MTPERWREVERVLHAALESAPPERAALLDRECAGDAALRAEVESLLASTKPSDSFLGASALEDATVLLGREESGTLVGRGFGHYFVEARLGAGGMGEVYLARDLALGRKVALKLLDAFLARDASSRARFLREARLAASLDHPNVCAIHEVSEAEGCPFIAMQYVEGRTLKDLIGGRPLPPDRILSISPQVAEALAAAHGRGIVHRDIKTTNIMVTPQGQAKVLDFGIAKLLEKDGDGAGPDVTSTGQLLGTPAAMSPEQARGERVDARTDVWSLGVVLYEMATGRAPFAGATASEVIALILQGEPPPLSHHAPGVPAALQRIVSKALRKDPAERYQTVREMLDDLRAAGPPVKRRWGGAAVAAAALLVALTLAGVALYRYALRGDAPRADGSPAPFRTTKITRLTAVGTSTAASVSPDGRYVAYVVGEAVRSGYFSRWPSGRSSLWVKQVSTDSAVEVIPAADVQYKGTTFSRDGEFVYYVAVDGENPAGALYRVSVLGGTPRKVLTDIDSAIDFSPDGRQFAFVRARPAEGSDALMVADAGGGGERTLAVRGGNDWFEADGPAWSPDGRTIVCGAGTDTGGTSMTLVEVPAEGGEPRVITPHRWKTIGRAAWLGDGSGLVFVAGENLRPGWVGTDAQVWHVAYPGGNPRRITNDLDGYTHTSIGLTADSRAVVTSQEDTSARIWTVALDGSPAGAARQVTAGKFDGRHGLSWSPDGRVVYVTTTGEEDDLWIVNADGTGQRRLTDDDAYDEMPAVSPDGRHVYFVSDRSGTRQLWRMDINGERPQQLTEGPAINYEPSVSPDGRWIVFTSLRSGVQALWKMPAEGGEAARLTEGTAGRALFSPDGRFIACGYFDAEGGGQWRLAIIPSEGGKPTRLLDLTVPEVNALAGLHWTPDGRAIVYVETRGGVSNVWRLPLAGGRPVRLTNFDSGQIFNLALSPDGRRLALARGGITSDVVLIRDLR